MKIAQMDSHIKLYISMGMAAVTFGISSLIAKDISLRLMASWLAYSGTSLFLAWTTILSSHPKQVRVEAHVQDSNRTLVFLFMMAACFASLFAIVILLRKNAGKPDTDGLLDITIPLFCVAAAWWLVHTVFTLRYAHFYYCNVDHETNTKITAPGGLSFPGKAQPGYMDFVYFSFVVGMTFQVSDVAITSPRIRQLAWMHGVLSFAFNTIIVALTINILSGMVKS
ncbi:MULTISPECIES: DUF1345 domain-containing protein [Sphingobacterium]|uniref:DUF1345 domain-containing protein n=1 Tax=Sphingobacterium TaxID=28453 RepID=UPI0008A1744C|nr:MULTISPECIES: DUF1345 domain-containing protein [Sphingobacterium]MBB1642686.1 hypothetical protein [Sphingobacterium sp. UME9]OFV09550.1 hypothetical protein HMPREF3127_23070 [Sphingobacterium sp. HMSC13C05]